MEKLLPKIKNTTREEVAQLVFKEGQPFFVNTIDRERKINTVRRWKQAFRVYATIYCGANPDRSPEIWQYVYIINKAAASYSWMNVMEYDITFRQMMGVNPHRSWGKTYTQMWNICMTEPLVKTGGRYQGGQPQGHTSQGPPRGVSHPRSTKPDYCWKFNKGKCKFGSDCKFVNWCSYCDSPAHSQNACPKKNSSTPGCGGSSGTGGTGVSGH